MNSDDIEWDPAKAASNARMHGGVTFHDAAAALMDLYVQTWEERNAIGEQRLMAVGMDTKLRLLTVVYTLRGDKRRIISARKADASQRRDYERQF
jgi:uncharacterized DUF497 family protein